MKLNKNVQNGKCKVVKKKKEKKKYDEKKRFMRIKV